MSSPADTPANPLADLPTPAVAFALGVCVGRPQRAETAGRVSALIAELRRRGAYDHMTATLDPKLRQALELMETVDRGQAWNRRRR